MAERERFVCKFCKRVFHTIPTAENPEPTACGRKLCFEKGNWTQADWDGAAEMAEARQSAGYSIAVLGETIDADTGRRTRRFGRAVVNEISALDSIALKRQGR